MDGQRVFRVEAVAWREIDGQAAVISLDSHRLRVLNETGSQIWKLCDGRTPAEIARELAEVFEVPEEHARRDVEAFVADLRSRGMVRVEGA